MRKCIEKVQEKLTEKNARLSITNPLVGAQNKVILSPEKIFSNKREKPVNLIAAYCPFCGNKNLKMIDPFHPAVKDEWLDQFFAVVALTPHITYQVLTKRPERMHKYFTATHGELIHDLGRKTILGRNLKVEAEMMRMNNCPEEGLREWPLSNLHLGVSVESQAAANERIPWLLKTPAAKRFLSCEPLLDQRA